MRHVLVSRSIATRPLGVGKAPRAAGLIASPGLVHRGAPRDLRTGSPAIDVAAIAARTQHHLRAATRAHEQPSCLAHRAPRPRAEAQWTPMTSGAILALAYGAAPLRAPAGGGAAASGLPRTGRRRALLCFGCRSIAASIRPRETGRQHSMPLLILPGGGALRAPRRTSEIEIQSRNPHQRRPRLELRGK